MTFAYDNEFKGFRRGYVFNILRIDNRPSAVRTADAPFANTPITC